VLGLGQFTAKHPDKAIGQFNKAIELNPSFALGHGYLALQLAFVAGPPRLLATSLAHLGRMDEARDAFAGALELTAAGFGDRYSERHPFQ